MGRPLAGSERVAAVGDDLCNALAAEQGFERVSLARRLDY